MMWESARAARAGGSAVASDIPCGDLADAWVWPFLWQVRAPRARPSRHASPHPPPSAAAQGSPNIFTAMFKAVEDRLNVKDDNEYGVQTLLLVEDSVKFYSSYLPVLYSEIWKQNRNIRSETMHAREKILRLHSRPKVLFCTNFEEAVDVYDRYRDNVMGIITDLGFPRDGVHDVTAGITLVEHVKQTNPRLPILLQSAQPEASARRPPPAARRPTRNHPSARRAGVGDGGDGV